MTGTRGPVRVGFVIDWLRRGAGTENQLILLLQAFDRGRIEPFVCHLRKHASVGTGEIRCPVDLIEIPKIASPAGLRGLALLRQWIRQRDISLIVTLFRDANIVGTLGARLAGVPIVSSRRNMGHWHTPMELRIVRILNRMTNAYIANSVAVRDYTVTSEGVPQESIEVIPNAIDTQRFYPSDNSPSEDRYRILGVPEGVLIGCVANLRKVKSIDTLLTAVGRSDLLRHECQVLLVGSGPEEGFLRALAAELAIADRVHFLGSRDDVPDILRVLDVAVLCSQAEGSPNAVLEYMATGLPVVASQVGGVAELIGLDGSAGIVVPTREPDLLRTALEALVQSPQMRRELGKQALKRAVARHSVAHVTDVWMQFLERVVRTHAH